MRRSHSAPFGGDCAGCCCAECSPCPTAGGVLSAGGALLCRAERRLRAGKCNISKRSIPFVSIYRTHKSRQMNNHQTSMQCPEVLLCCSSPAELLLLQGPFFTLSLPMGGGLPGEGGGTVSSAGDGPGHPESQLPPGAHALNPRGIYRGKQMGSPKPAPLHRSTPRHSCISELCPCAPPA